VIFDDFSLLTTVKPVMLPVVSSGDDLMNKSQPPANVSTVKALLHRLLNEPISQKGLQVVSSRYLLGRQSLPKDRESKNLNRVLQNP
jgi:hypothetical protein